MEIEDQPRGGSLLGTGGREAEPNSFKIQQNQRKHSLCGKGRFTSCCKLDCTHRKLWVYSSSEFQQSNHGIHPVHELLVE